MNPNDSSFITANPQALADLTPAELNAWNSFQRIVSAIDLTAPPPVGRDALCVTAGLLTLSAATNPSIASTDLSDVSYGPWTPDLQFGGANTGITYASRSGYFRSILKHVIIQFAFALSNNGTATGVATLAGLPLPVGDGFQGFWPFMDLGGLASAGGGVMGGAYMAGDASGSIRFAMNNIANNPNQNQITQMTNADFTNTTAIQGSFVYLTA